jgi:sigma-E factor negative regulatory protein RseC
MIEAEARVLRCEGEQAWVELRPHTPCGHCDPQRGCRSLSLARAFHTGQSAFAVSNPLSAQAGDWVVVAARADSVRHSALLLYGVPLAALLAGALLGAPLGEGWSMALSGLGLAASLLALAWHARRAPHLDAHRPVITRLISQPSSTVRNVSSCQHARSPGDWSA